jgi:hypothetical protein
VQMIMEVTLPNEPFNTLVKKGTAGETLQRILADVKPSAAYFSELDGRRGAIFIVDLPDPSRVPALAEPFFVLLDATVKFRICMTAEDLAKSGLEEIGKKLA